MLPAGYNQYAFGAGYSDTGPRCKGKPHRQLGAAVRRLRLAKAGRRICWPTGPAARAHIGDRTGPDESHTANAQDACRYIPSANHGFAEGPLGRPSPRSRRRDDLLIERNPDTPDALDEAVVRNTAWSNIFDGPCTRHTDRAGTESATPVDVRQARSLDETIRRAGFVPHRSTSSAREEGLG